jgi:geranylgeranyl transferase type-2 subunit beta
MSFSGVKRRPTHTEHADSQNKDDLTYHMTAHLRMNAVYWGVTALCIMKHKEALDAEETIEYVMSCWDEEAGAPLLSLPRVMASHR